MICAVDEWVEYTRNQANPAVGSTECTTRSLWDDLSGQIFDVVAGITLQDLVDQGLAKSGAAEKLPNVASLRGRAA